MLLCLSDLVHCPLVSPSINQMIAWNVLMTSRSDVSNSVQIEGGSTLNDKIDNSWKL